MKDMIEEVKAYFKDAKEVKGTCGIIGVIDLSTIYKGITNCICCETTDGKYTMLYDNEDEIFAKIISYKSNPNIDLSKLTTDHIIELCKEPNIKEFMINNGVVKNELEVGKWYKSEKTGLWFIEEIINKEREKSFGIGKLGNFFSSRERYQSGDYIPATPQEVETALKNEIWKQFKIGDKIKCVNGTTTTIKGDIIRFENNVVLLSDVKYRYELFNNGKFAQVITEPKKEETYIKVPLSIITLTESKKKLGKIVKNLAKNV